MPNIRYEQGEQNKRMRQGKCLAIIREIRNTQNIAKTRQATYV
jgi:hypothetical protein